MVRRLLSHDIPITHKVSSISGSRSPQCLSHIPREARSITCFANMMIRDRTPNLPFVVWSWWAQAMCQRIRIASNDIKVCLHEQICIASTIRDGGAGRTSATAVSTNRGPDPAPPPHPFRHGPGPLLHPCRVRALSASLPSLFVLRLPYGFLSMPGYTLCIRSCCGLHGKDLYSHVIH